ncbi:MAG: glycine cleavage system protein H [Thermodesulfobacteriota bacterium]
MNAHHNEKRSRLGYGSTYQKGSETDQGGMQGIRTVLGGQIWTVSPDQSAENPNPCIWMQAGVVKFKNCNNFYDCTSCKYDLGMNMKVAQGKQASWQNAMRKKSALQRVCRHSLTGRIANRSCAYDYHCESCDFDQYFEDVWTVKAGAYPNENRRIKGFELPADYHFHGGHAWARIESGGYIRVGLDDFALKLFGKADALQLPLMGKELNQGKAGWGLKRKGNEADVLSPVDGVIVEVNANVRENPTLANQEPYGAGWLFMIKTPDIKKTVKPLMNEQQSLAWINGEIETLEHMIEEVAGPLAADGGFLGSDIIGALPSLGWRNLARTFLKS